LAFPIDWVRSDKSSGILERVADLVENSVAANTRRTYQSDLAQFESWGGKIPATPSMVRSQTGHASDAMLSRYVRDGELFVGNAPGRYCDRQKGDRMCNLARHEVGTERTVHADER
jgi:hypothetical protein